MAKGTVRKTATKKKSPLRAHRFGKPTGEKASTKKYFEEGSIQTDPSMR